MNTSVLLITLGLWLVKNSENTNANTVGNYVISPMKLNWKRATMYCRRRSMFLVAIDSEAKQKIISDMKDDHGWDSMWLGATDDGEEGVFRWESTGRKLEYEKWHSPWQPDNQGGIENCMEMGNEFWNDAECILEKKFICERPNTPIC